MTDAPPTAAGHRSAAPPDVRHRAENALVRAAAAVFRRLPLDVISGAVGHMAGMIGPALPFDRRARENLDRLWPELDRPQSRAIRRRMYDNFARTGIEYLFLETLRHDHSRIRTSGLEHVPADGPVLFVTGHFGNWEAVRIALAEIDRPPALLYRAFNNPLFDRFSRDLMAVIPGRFMHKGRRGSLALVRHVAEGGAGLILVDQRMTGAPETPFLGQPALTSTAPAEIALRCKAPLIPVRARRLGRASRFSVTFEAPIDTTDAATMTRAINDRLSAWINDDPGQWFWLHNRWKNAGGTPPAF